MLHHFKDTVTVSRATTTGYKTSYETVKDIPCHIQPVSDSYAMADTGRDARDFRMFSTDAVRIGDRLKDQNDKLYEVYGVKHHRFRGKQHYESSLRAN